MISHRLIVGNYVVEMRKLETGPIDLILTDPTFNIGKEYGGVCKNNMEFNDYIDWCKTWSKLYRVDINPEYVKIGEKRLLEILDE